MTPVRKQSDRHGALTSRLAWSAGLAALAFAASAQGAAAQGPAAQGAAAQDARCSALAEAGRFPNATVSSAKLAPADAAARTPPYCEVTAVLSPVPGSRIGVVYRLPMDWNGKIVGYGGGGWAGNVRLETAAGEIARGYATMQTDGGHPSANAGDASWTAPGGKPNVVALNDYAWRAVHTMTDTGKQVVAAYYGRPQIKAYFQGCSSGGRMALMEAQRFPGDYDGIVSGAPVYSLRTQLGEIYRDWIFAQPGAAITPAQIGLVHKAVLAACDDVDGVKDGIVGDPKACKFDPGALQCKAGQSGDQCLTAPQVTAFRRQYSEVRGPDSVYISPYSKGSEPGWLFAVNITADPVKAARVRDLDLRTIMFGDPNFSFASFDAMRDSPKARAGAFAKYYEADNPDLKPFLSKGGKLILWHGLDDQLPSPWATVDYYQRVEKATGEALTHADTRFFLAPGVMHCGGGPGANTFDFIQAIDAWVSGGPAPERIVGEHVARPPAGAPPSASAPPAAPMTRPICAYPALPRYGGSGDPNDEKSFVCR